MNSLPLFGLSVLMSFVAFGIVTRTYIWPQLRMARREEALIALMVPHTFRFIGLSFLIPGVVSLSLPAGFSFPAAYGDLFAAILAVLAIWSLSARAWFATSLVWVFNVGAPLTSWWRSIKACSAFASTQGRSVLRTSFPRFWCRRSSLRTASCSRCCYESNEVRRQAEPRGQGRSQMERKTHPRRKRSQTAT